MIFCDLRFFTEDAKVEHKVFTDRQYHMSCKIDKAKDSTKEFSSNLFLPPNLISSESRRLPGGFLMQKKKPGVPDFLKEAPPGIGPGIRVLQTRALPLG
jgi:hypothetical protein